MKISKSAYEYHFVYCLGSVAYAATEILYRGHTHWTMVITGGVCAASIHHISKKTEGRSLTYRAFLGSGAVTLLELSVGCMVNRFLKWQVWDYSNIPLNILGQICPLFSFFWFLMCIPGVMLCDKISKSFKIYFSLKDIKD